MPINLPFGFVLGRTGGVPKQEDRKTPSFVAPDYDDGAVPIEVGGYYGSESAGLRVPPACGRATAGLCAAAHPDG